MINNKKIMRIKVAFTILLFGFICYSIAAMQLASEVPRFCNKDSFINHLKQQGLANIEKQKIDTIDMRVNFKALKAIESERMEALELGIINKTKWHKAILNINGADVNAEIRLKGDFTDHINEKPWSYRIKLKDGLFGGMRVFSLQKASTRGYLVDYVFMKEAKVLGLLAPRYGFVNLTINGESMGVVAYEEHMSKELLESNGKKESSIAAFNDSDLWEYKVNNRELRAANPYENIRIVPVKFYSGKKLGNKDDYAQHILEQYQAGKMRFRDVFDISKMLVAVVLSDAWATQHPISWENAKFYLNPFTLKLEPILFDNGHIPTSMVRSLNANSEYSTLAHEVLKAASIVELKTAVELVSRVKRDWYVNQLNQFKKDYYFADSECMDLPIEVISNNKITMSDISTYFQRDWSKIDYLSVGVDLDRLSEFEQGKFHKYFYADQIKSDYLTLKTALPVKINIDGIELICDEKSYKKRVDILLNSAIPMFGRADVSISLKSISPNCSSKSLSQFNVSFNINGRENIEKFENKFVPQENFVNPLVDAANYIPYFIKKKNGVYIIPTGNWLIKSPLILSSSYPLIVEAGATISFSKNSYIISNADVHFKGTAERPILMKPESVDNNWAGLYVYNAKNVSDLSHVNVEGVAQLPNSILGLTGAFTFYQSAVDFKNVHISNVLAEDAINIVNSVASFYDVIIEKTTSDAIDLDFSNATFDNIKLSNIGGDGIDTSGSTVVVNGVNGVSVWDKLISVGEASNATIRNLSGDNLGAGVVIKDGSAAEVHQIDFGNNVLYDAMVYVKKDEYTSPRLSLFTENSKDIRFVCQSGTKLLYNGLTMPCINVDVKNMYANGRMKK